MGPVAWVFENTGKNSGGVKIIQRTVETKKLLMAVRHEFSAPVTGITLCAQVGWRSGCTFDNGFAVNSIPRSKGMMEAQGEKVSAIELFDILFTFLQKRG